MNTAIGEKRKSQELTFTGCFCIHYPTPITNTTVTTNVKDASRTSGTEAEELFFPPPIFHFLANASHWQNLTGRQPAEDSGKSSFDT